MQRLGGKRSVRSTEATKVKDAVEPTARILCICFTPSFLSSGGYCSSTESMILCTTSTASLSDCKRETSHCGRSRRSSSSSHCCARLSPPVPSAAQPPSYSWSKPLVQPPASAVLKDRATPGNNEPESILSRLTPAVLFCR